MVQQINYINMLKSLLKLRLHLIIVRFLSQVFQPFIFRLDFL